MLITNYHKVLRRCGGHLCGPVQNSVAVGHTVVAMRIYAGLVRVPISTLASEGSQLLSFAD